jgi:hypothetical protein
MRRPCKKCEEYFEPATRHTWVCNKCMEKIWKRVREKNRKIRRKAKKKNAS